MAEGSKVRLVRCPKCENLLQELADFSVYKCGSCGAVLRGTLSFLLFLFSLSESLCFLLSLFSFGC
jgi:DNA-directed RNA polymerase subunit RPC12/RpoP